METLAPTWKPHVLGYPELYNGHLDPRFKEFGYEVVINVSDVFHAGHLPHYRERGIEAHWFPLNECLDFGLNSLYAAMSILWEAERQGKMVLIHCAAGINRSQVVMDCYYFLRKGTHRAYPFSLIETVKVNFVNAGGYPDSRQEERPWTTMLHRACANGHLPTITDMETWLTSLGQRLDAKNGFGIGDLDDSLLKIKPLGNK
jgi:hypothetical protein